MMKINTETPEQRALLNRRCEIKRRLQVINGYNLSVCAHGAYAQALDEGAIICIASYRANRHKAANECDQAQQSPAL